ncbi:aspartic proteinase NANA, chloroplast-like [Andrographis paniculata]|uniref:aspartic proteinase NANA, chloroplast-like n=1 Tax=Andrographis paniculata TaxID=175694 RepID=UPI0021E85D73|nr:aspartic proteinase NANA, chloroplast-like [Andrographis paniculata]
MVEMCSDQRALLFHVLTILFITVVSVQQGYGNGSVKLELIHRHGNGTGRKWSSFPLRQLLHRDAIRLAAISEKLSMAKTESIAATTSRRRIQESNAYYFSACKNGTVSGQLPMHSGADAGAGQYFVHFRVGSPAQRVVLVADTGSDLTWMNCKYSCHGVRCRRRKKKKERDFRKRRVFLADHSSSFRTLPCSSAMCKVDLANLFSLARCPSPMDPCAYDYRYSDGSAAVGLFANETVTFRLTTGRKLKLHNVLVGCSESSRGESFQGADGVMGLAYSNHSFAVTAAARFRGKFSYCLVDHLSPKNVSSYLIFGSHDESRVTLGRMRYTELVLGVLSSFYAVNLRGISVGGSMLDIPTETWDVNGVGGLIIDSGSSLTSLVQPAYQPVMAAIRLTLLNFANLNLDIGPLEYCFNSTGFDESAVPRLAFHFADGARFEPHVKSYVIDAAPGVKCLGFVPAAWPGSSVIGNIMQQNHLWEFDIVNRRLGFAASSCST